MRFMHHRRSRTYSKLIFVLMLSAVVLHCAKKVDPNPPQNDVAIAAVPHALILDSAIPADRQALLSETISSLYVMPNIDLSAHPDEQATAKMMGISDMAPETLQKWMEERAHYVVNDDFDIENRVKVSTDSVVYPNRSQIPDIVKTLTTDDAKPDTTPKKGVVVMLNRGGAIYIDGKLQNKLLTFTLTDGTQVEMVSPRVGLIQIGSGMFSILSGSDVQNVAKDFFLVSSLFHEARHSDGNGKTLGFLHSMCTSGDYKGDYACDAAANGPYTIGSGILKALMDSCDDRCTEKSRSVLQLLYVDQSSRLLGDQDLPGASPETRAGKNWDDSPETTGN